MENSRELKEIGESFSALKRYTVLSGQEDVEDAVIEQGEYPYTLRRAGIQLHLRRQVDLYGRGRGSQDLLETTPFVLTEMEASYPPIALPVYS